MNAAPIAPRLRAAAAAALGLALAGFLFWGHHAADGGKLLHVRSLLQLAWLVPAVLMALACRARGAAAPAAEADPGGPAPAARWLWVGLVLFLFGGAAAGPWFYFIGWAPAARSVSNSTLTLAVALAAIFWAALPLADARRRRFTTAATLALLAFQLVALGALLNETRGQALYRDDHPSFLFRLWAFGKVFPHLVYYTPHWNGGVVEGVLCKTGATAPGVLLWPLWRWFPVEAVYTPAMAFIYIFFVPWMVVLSARTAGAGPLAARIAGILALGVSHAYFLWFLHFGTVGANLASAFLVPVCAGLYRLVVLGKRDLRTAAMVVVSGFFLLQWPPGAVMLLPVALAALPALPRLDGRGWLWLAGCAALVALLSLKSALILYMGSAALADFALRPADAPDAGAVSWLAVAVAGLRRLADQCRQGHPLAVFFGLGGACCLANRDRRRWFVIVLGGLACLTAWGPEAFPRLQLERLAIPMLLVALIPAGMVAAQLLTSGSAVATPVRALVLALLALTGVNVALLYSNRGPAPYNAVPEKVRDLATRLRAEVPEGGRVLFAGATVHSVGRGHVAFLPRLAGREMMACDYYAFPVGTVEYDYPPRPYRGRRADTFRFMDLHNVTHVVTTHGHWRRYLADQPARYTPLILGAEGTDDISLFALKREPAALLEGDGRVTADFNRIVVTPAAGAERLVLRYNWHEGLAADPPAEIFPVKVWKDLRFVGVRPNGARTVTIRFRTWL